MRKTGSQNLVVVEQKGGLELAAPKLIADAGAAAGFAWEEFFIGK